MPGRARILFQWYSEATEDIHFWSGVICYMRTHSWRCDRWPLEYSAQAFDFSPHPLRCLRELRGSYDAIIDSSQGTQDATILLLELPLLESGDGNWPAPFLRVPYPLLDRWFGCRGNVGVGQDTLVRA